ncbi:MAG: nicotinate phosphoribosyltransferase [Burkholderiales bacterium]
MIPPASALLTDLYQLSMLQAYFDEGLEDTAVFEFFVRKLPSERNFLLAAGLAQVLDYLEQLRFTSDEIEWLASTGRYPPAFLDYLGALRFRGSIYAMPEGTVFFADEPILRVTAPIAQAQLVETRIVNLLNFQVMIASKAARCMLAGRGKLLVDFGLRRAHGAEAGLLAARACYLAGFSGTATVQAGREFGVPLFGTMAHSYIQAHEREEAAFERFATSQPGNVTLLIDTYDTEAAAHKVAVVAPRLRAQGIDIRAVRLDSGDIAEHAGRVRRIFDLAGLAHIRIFCSGNMDEYEIERLLATGTPIDGFGVGTRLDTSADAPYLDCVYKLEEYAGRARRKRSEGKSTWPGRKQVFRRHGADGRIAGDVITVEGETQPGEALMVSVMVDGRRTLPQPSLEEIRERAASELARLPEPLRQLSPAQIPYPVEIAAPVQRLAERVDQYLSKQGT